MKQNTCDKISSRAVTEVAASRNAWFDWKTSTSRQQPTSVTTRAYLLALMPLFEIRGTIAQIVPPYRRGRCNTQLRDGPDELDHAARRHVSTAVPELRKAITSRFAIRIECDTVSSSHASVASRRLSLSVGRTRSSPSSFHRSGIASSSISVK